MEDVWFDGDVDSPQHRLIQSQRRQLLAEGYTLCDNNRESAATPSLKEVGEFCVPCQKAILAAGQLYYSPNAVKLGETGAVLAV